MGIVKHENIMGLHLRTHNDAELVCSECCTDEEWANMVESEIVTQEDIDREGEEYYFCDRCKKRL